jgi:hypothetical protein
MTEFIPLGTTASSVEAFLGPGGKWWYLHGPVHVLAAPDNNMSQSRYYRGWCLSYTFSNYTLCNNAGFVWPC